MAVFTNVSSDDAASLLSRYDIGTVISLKGITAGSDNSNFLLETTAGRYILTLYEKRIPRQELPFFLTLLQYMAQHGIPCPLPIMMKDGALLTEVVGKPAAIVSFLNGKSVTAITAQHCAAVGAQLAQLHLVGHGFGSHRDNSLSLDFWLTRYGHVKDRADTVKNNLAGELNEYLQMLEKHWPKALPTGVIHADLFPDNVFFEQGSISALIDFYFACNDFLIYDVAICMNAWCFEQNGEFNITKSRALLAAYHAVRPIETEEIAALPIIAQGAAMRFLLTRLYDWLNPAPGALLTPKNPLEYLQKLRFHHGITDAASYGMDRSLKKTAVS